jgi:hypothetical protein
MSRTVLAAALLLAFSFALAGPKLSLPASETGPMTINLAQGYAFDPLQGVPPVPAGLAASDFRSDYGYCMIQFPGPVRPEWKAAVERRGAELLWYVPNYAFVARVPRQNLGAISNLPEVRWLGIDQPAWKLCPGIEKATGRQTLIVVFHYAEDAAALLADLRDIGADNFLPEFNAWNKSVKLDVDASQIPAIAQLNGVYWIEPWGEITPDNADAQWIDQKGYSASDTSRPVWAKGVTGSSVFVGITDEQLWMSHDMFRDTVNNTPGPSHRKVVSYFGTQGAGSHGTHTSGTLCGNDAPVGGTSLNDGLAKDARLFFQYYSSFPSGWDMNVWFHGPDSGVSGMRAFNHSMSLSRKDTFNIYIFSDMTADQFVWNHRAFLHCNSMGNYGYNQMGHPVMAKNIISTGGTLNGTSCRSFYTTSSRGPTQDGRRKPQLISPADNLYSASSSNPSGYVAMSGTSMATPNMTGSMALIRDYFRKGFYPTGDTTTGTPLEITAALNKAVGIVGADNDLSGYTAPDNNIGWGRVDLDSSLYFAGDTSKLWVADETLGLETGDSLVYTLDVTSDAKPFRVTLCWSDYPGTMRAAYILVNNLDLTVISPTGDTFKGSVYSSGQSVTGGIHDTLNVEECVRRNTPDVGTWTVKVNARNIPQGPQPFALAAIGVFEEAAPPAHDVGATAIVAPTDTIDTGTVVTPRAVVRNFGASEETFLTRFTIGATYTDTMTVTIDAGASDTLTFANWVADSVGTYPVKCSTQLAGDETPANDKITDSVVVFPFTGIEEGSGLPTAFSLDRVLPNPTDGRTSVRYGLPRPSTVNLSVYSAAGTLVRTIAAGKQNPGWYNATWDGSDSRGREVGTGVYLVRFEAGAYKSTRKLVVQR